MRSKTFSARAMAQMLVLSGLVALAACASKEQPSATADASADMASSLDAAADTGQTDVDPTDADNAADVDTPDTTATSVSDVADTSIPVNPCATCGNEDDCRGKPCVAGTYTCNVTPICGRYVGACTCVNGKFACTSTDCPKDVAVSPDIVPDTSEADAGPPPKVVPANCTELVSVYQAEMKAIRACTGDAECGQVLKGTSCGCTNNLVATKGADASFFFKLLKAGTDKGCPGIGGISTCDCPAADGFICKAGFCAWNYK